MGFSFLGSQAVGFLLLAIFGEKAKRTKKGAA
jgi:hypothetical protein